MSSTHLSHKLGLWVRAKGLEFELFHKHVGNDEADGVTHGSTMDLFIILALEEEVCVFEAELQDVTICCIDMLVLWESVRSWCNFCLTKLIEGSTGIEVKRALTSYNVITSPGSSFTSWMCCMK